MDLHERGYEAGLVPGWRPEGRGRPRDVNLDEVLAADREFLRSLVAL